MSKSLLSILILILCIGTSHSYSQEIEWQNTIGGNFNDKLHSIQQTADGGFILGGNSNSNISGDKTEINRGAYDFWIVKDYIGNIQWQKPLVEIVKIYFIIKANN
ncbi:MAG: hypothetical protein IPJ26_05475 [Bacteroidetes bacterium]|nr:hypothetical protein [Bacteroidota bacterium]